MARMDLRVRAWGWLTRRQAGVIGMTDDQVIAMQRRHMPDNAVTRWLFGAVPPGVAVAGRTIPGPDDNEIPVLVYRPAPGQPDRAVPGQATRPGGDSDLSARPLVVYFHGGGFVFGNPRMGDWVCGNVAAGVGAVVISVDYRLAPTHRFPAAVDDCYAVVEWAAAHAAEFGGAGPVGVMGESAGGNLAAVVSLLARDRGGPAISHQALIYPATDMRDSATESGSARANRDAPFLSPDEMTAYRNLYLGPGADPSDPKASPLLAAGHGGLPPALIQVAEHDPLRDDGNRYAAALRAAGVPVRLTEYVGEPHGFLNFPGLCRGARQALAELCAEQKAALTAALQPDGRPAEPAMGG
jgi:acetyl esterase/lipase